MIDATITLPPSKSISNRALIIQALCENSIKIRNLSNATDTITLQDILKKINKGKETMFDAKDGGTTFRFLTSYLAFMPGKWVLTGSERMMQRPIAPLVNVLRQLGAEINYKGNENFAPLEIIGGKMVGGKATIDASVSSQFISSLLMIAPMLENGLELKMDSHIVSRPYIKMTISMMEYFGIMVTVTDNTIKILKQDYKPRNITIEPDWTAAYYWYEILAFHQQGTILLKGLKEDSWQGDISLHPTFKKLCVETKFNKKGVEIQFIRRPKAAQGISETFINMPDLAPTLFATCAGCNIEGIFWGLDTLKDKESNRLEACRMELEKFGVETELTIRNTLYIKKGNKKPKHPVVINTYNDHRMAMAFACLCIPFGKLIIQNPDVVNKSYPSFWNDLKSVGFEIIEN